jgi:acyl-CoA thioesterase YciA
MEAKAKCPSLVELMMPEHENPSGNIFGGVLLSKIDIAGAIAARQAHPGRVVTVAMDSVIFKKPVLRGDLLICWADIVKIGKTSITTKIRVEVNRGGEIIQVTEAEATYVAVDAKGVKIPVGTKDDGTVVKPKLSDYCVACNGEAHGNGEEKVPAKTEDKTQPKADEESKAKKCKCSKKNKKGKKNSKKNGKKHDCKYSKKANK